MTDIQWGPIALAVFGLMGCAGWASTPRSRWPGIEWLVWVLVGVSWGRALPDGGVLPDPVALFNYLLSAHSLIGAVAALWLAVQGALWAWRTLRPRFWVAVAEVAQRRVVELQEAPPSDEMASIGSVSLADGAEVVRLPARPQRPYTREGA